MRTLLRLMVVPAALVAVACGTDDQRGTATRDGDFQQDLKLASASNLDLAPAQQQGTLSSLETAPLAAPAPAPKPKRANGPRRVQAEQPTAESAPAEEAAPAESEVAETETEAPAPEPQVATVAGEGVALPRPVPVPGGDVGTVSRGPSTGEVIGTVIGVVIRGGGTGEDHCEIHDRGRRGGRPNGPWGGRPVYRPIPGGVGGARFPINPAAPRY